MNNFRNIPYCLAAFGELDFTIKMIKIIPFYSQYDVHFMVNNLWNGSTNCH